MRLFKRFRKIEELEVKEDRPDLTSMIMAVYNEEAYAEYAGATLCLKNQMYTDDETKINGGNELYLLSLEREDLTTSEKFWLACCYIKYKKSGSKIKDAYNIVKNYEDTNTSVKVLLEA